MATSKILTGDHDKIRAALGHYCGLDGEDMPITNKEIDKVYQIVRRHRDAEAEFRALDDRYPIGVAYWMDQYFRGVVNTDGSYNQ